jgi:hypothetical protein
MTAFAANDPVDQDNWPQGYAATLWLCVASFVLWMTWRVGNSTLWLDETLTAWITSSDLRTCFDRAWHYQGQSPLYFVLVWCVRQFLGSSELALRALSLLAVGGSAVTFRALLQQAGYRRDSWIGALTVTVILLADNTAGLSARPYPLAICCSLLALLSLLRWIDRPSQRTWLLYVAATSLTILLHYIFATVVLLHLLVLARTGLKDKRILYGSPAALAAVGVCLLPAVPHLLVVAQKSKLYTISDPPTLQTTIEALGSSAGVWMVLCLGVVLQIAGRTRSLREAAREFAPGLCWWAVAPLGILLIYQLTGVCVNVPRYYLWRLPAIGLLVIAAVRVAGSYRVAALPLILLLSFVVPALRTPEATGWKEAFEWGQQYPVADFEPVVYSGLIESSNAVCVADAEFREYLLAPLRSYSSHTKGQVLPLRLTRSEALFQKTLGELLRNNNGLVFYLCRMPDVSDEVRRRAVSAGHEIVAGTMTEDVEVIVTRCFGSSSGVGSSPGEPSLVSDLR